MSGERGGIDVHGEIGLRRASDGATEQASRAARHVGLVRRKVFDVTRSEEQDGTGGRRLDPGLSSVKGAELVSERWGILKQLVSSREVCPDPELVSPHRVELE